MPGLANNVTVLIPKKKIGSQKEPEKKMRVAAYARVSTDSDEQEGSYEVQVQYYTQLIQGNPAWEFVGVYTDDGISGTNTAKRSGFLEMIEDCRKRKIDMILTKSISRFARNTVDCLNYTRELRNLNIAVKFEKENINTLEAAGEVLLTIMAAMAQQESESLSANVHLGIRFRFEQGIMRVNYSRFLGYTKGPDGKLKIVPEQAEIVRRIYDDFLVRGMTPRQIIRDLEEHGLRNGAGSTKWCESNIHQILTNEKYIGDALLQTTWTVNTLEKIRRINKGDQPQYYVEGSHEGIISKATFAAVQEELERRSNIQNSAGKKRVYHGNFVFSSFLHCGYCGDVYTRRHYRSRGEYYAMWKCYKPTLEHETGTITSIREDTLQDMVVMAINKKIKGSRKGIKLLRSAMEEGLKEPFDAKLAEIDEQLRAAKEKFDHLPNSSPEAETVDKELRKLEDWRLRVEKDAMLAEHKAEELAKMAEMFEGFKYPLEAYDDEYVRRLMEKATVYADRVVFVFKDGEEVEVKRPERK